MKRIASLLTLLIACGCLPSERAVDSDEVPDFLGQTPPELQAGIALNSSEPLSLKQLQGKVVWLEFSFLH